MRIDLQRKNMFLVEFYKKNIWPLLIYRVYVYILLHSNGSKTVVFLFFFCTNLDFVKPRLKFNYT